MFLTAAGVTLSHPQIGQKRISGPRARTGHPPAVERDDRHPRAIRRLSRADRRSSGPGPAGAPLLTCNDYGKGPTLRPEMPVPWCDPWDENIPRERAVRLLRLATLV